MTHKEANKINSAKAASAVQQRWLSSHQDVISLLSEPLPPTWNTTTPYLFHCPTHGDYHMTLYAKAKGRVCPRCAKAKAAKAAIQSRQSAQLSRFLKSHDFSDMHPDDYMALCSGSLLASQEARFYCPTHGYYSQRPTNHYTLGERCPYCATGSRQSNQERELHEILKAWGISFDTNTRVVIKPYELDIYIPSHALAIEFNGSMFHGSLGPQYTGCSHKEPLYHFNKFKMCIDKGIHLIQIYDVDWWTNKERILNLLHDLLCPCKVVYARKCEIVPVSKQTACEFYDKNHVQGSSHFCTLTYGLCYEGTLVACMSFGKPRFSTKGVDYELHRYAVLSGHVVKGGAERLFKRFIQEQSSATILSYSDNDYFTGSMYGRLGFTNAGFTDPRYYWYHNKVALRREQCMLKHLAIQYPQLYAKATGNKEDFIMTSIGATKVFRSGNQRWIYSPHKPT